MTNLTLETMMTLEEFIRRYDEEGPFEILDGEIVVTMATIAGHGNTTDNLVWVLNQHIRPAQLGRTYFETPYVLSYDSQWVKGSRIPDVMFFAADRLATYQAGDPDWQNKPLVLIPDLAVEIVSPNDKFTEVNSKVKLYLQDGVKLVWIIDPQLREIMIYTPNSQQTTILTADDRLSGGNVLPDFEVAVANLFKD
ncbi:MAG: Uma2 family endonuclease [Anaerolineae bacterium]|nr:Uma2 family endonuclease [Anaerolineae bacterium]